MLSGATDPGNPSLAEVRTTCVFGYNFIAVDNTNYALILVH